MSEGYIKVFRQLMDWEWYQDGNTFRVFMHLLLLANYQDHRFRGMEIKRGQCITSVDNISKSLGISDQSVRTAIKHLKSTNEITSESTKGSTLVTIENFNKYQGEDAEANKQTNKQTNNQVTNDQQTTNKRLTTYKKEKKENKENNNKKLRESKERNELSNIEIRRRLYNGAKNRVVPDAMSESHRLWLETVKRRERGDLIDKV